MKKIIYAILGIFMMAACTDDHLADISTSPNGETGEKVKVKFSVQVPEAKAAGSRSFSSPAINTLHLAVFDANGYLTQVVLASRENNSTELGEFEEPIEFTADLGQTPNKRIIHFLANKTINEDDFGSESDLIGTLYTESKSDAYWQRVELPNGINVGKGWNDANNNNKVDDGEMVDVNTIGDKLTKVPLIRNFAKITVNTKEEGVTTPGNVPFIFEGFTVVNVPECGSVAPFNTNGGGFAQFVDDNKNAYDYATLTGTNGYTGFMPEEVNISNTIGEFQTNEFYMYERNGQAKNTNRTFVIVKGRFGGESATPTYYKIDLIYKTGNNTNYFEILRNFNYNIIINQVEAAGAGTVTEAAGMIGSHNNLSAAIETQSLLNISDGASRLFVSHTEYVFVTGSTYNEDGTIIEASTMQLKYRYVPDISVPTTVKNDDATYSLETKTNPSDVAVASVVAATNDEDGWRTLTVTAGKMDDNDVKSQTLTLVADNLSRTVNFILRPKFNFSNEKATSPTPANTSKSPFVYSFTIPETIIPESLFPLTFIVQATPENIYPNADLNSLPVQVLDGKSTFGYEREVTYEEYVATGGIINCYFRVNTTAYSGTKLTVSNPYFNTSDEVELNDNNSTYAFSNLTVNDGEAVPYGVENSVTFTFDMPYVDTTNGTEVTITANKMSAMSRATTFTYTATQTGTQTVTFTTREFASADRIKLEASNYITGIKAYENKLQIKASTINLVTGTTATALRVYGSESAAKDYKNHLAEPLTSNLTSTFTDVALTGLTAESLVWFAYQSGDYIYVASARAGELAKGTATITFNADNKVDVPLDMSVVFGEGTQYYGINKTFTMTFTTNKAGTYTLSSDDVLTFSSDVGISNNQFKIDAAGTYSITCTTKTWATTATATVTCGSATVSCDGVTRNTLKVTAQTTIKFNKKPGGGETKSVTLSYGNSSTTVNITQGKDNQTYYIPTGDIVLEGLTASDNSITVTYNNNSTTISAANLMNGGTSISIKN